MRKYLGETLLDIHTTEYAMYSPQDWSILWIEKYGQYDGGHHKQWVLDQVVRILKGTKIKIKLAKWDDGTEEFRFSLDEPTEKYNDWVEYMKGPVEDGEFTYDYDEGIAP